MVIHHGVNDPQIKKIQNLVLWYKNISLVHIVNQEELIQTIRDANAVIYIPKDEDFWLIPIEAMSCGIPVIGVNEWGLKETILDNKTGTLIDPFEIEEGLQKAVEKLSLENCAAMKDACIKHIRKFSLEIFESALIEEIHK